MRLLQGKHHMSGIFLQSSCFVCRLVYTVKVYLSVTELVKVTVSSPPAPGWGRARGGLFFPLRVGVCARAGSVSSRVSRRAAAACLLHPEHRGRSSVPKPAASAGKRPHVAAVNARRRVRTPQRRTRSRAAVPAELSVAAQRGGASEVLVSWDSNYAQRDLEQLNMAVFAIRREGEGLQEPPEDIGIVIEGMEVLHELTSVTSACALLLGLIYVLNPAYPKPLSFHF
ncbi:hypothetical protein MHYP_G00087000 [Metynnis hypsauchen]